jgi:hypothetical protein
MTAKQATTTIRFAKAIECDGRTVDSVAFVGEPGSERLPVNERDGEFELDALEMLAVIARRTGLSRPAVERLQPVDFMAVSLALFLPSRKAEIIPIENARKVKR